MNNKNTTKIKARINKTAIFLLVLFIALSALCVICINMLGRTYTYNIHIDGVTAETYDINVEFENEGIVSVKKIYDQKIVFGALSEGDTLVSITYTEKENNDSSPTEFGNSIQLAVTPSGVIINQTDIDFNGYRIVIYAAFIYLAAALACLIISAKKTFKENFYSYKSILKVGVAVFISMLLLTLLMQEIAYLAFGVTGLYSFISTIAFSADNIVILLLPIIAGIFILISISNSVLLKREGKRVRNVLGVILGALFISASFVGIFMNHFASAGLMDDSSESFFIFNFVRLYLCYLVIYFDCIFLGACICAVAASRRIPAFDKDFIIILGCSIRKDGTLTPLLKGRTDRAISFAKEQFKATGKKCLIIPSGGKGSDERCSEGDAMKRYLLDQGIPEEDILVENQSRNTYENMIFSKRIADTVNPDPKLAFATTNYHLFRSGLIANEAGIKIDGIGSKTKWYFWPNAFLREFLGVMRYELKYHALSSIVILIVTLALMITYKLVSHM